MKKVRSAEATQAKIAKLEAKGNLKPIDKIAEIVKGFFVGGVESKGENDGIVPLTAFAFKSGKLIEHFIVPPEALEITEPQNAVKAVGLMWKVKGVEFDEVVIASETYFVSTKKPTEKKPSECANRKEAICLLASRADGKNTALLLNMVRKGGKVFLRQGKKADGAGGGIIESFWAGYRDIENKTSEIFNRLGNNEPQVNLC